ncbi:hypothetical protein PVAND_013179 [Polypedilum vanderplanki]|uniref:Lipase domain-containing protein n=1 Tax=Polypedilum vanderplanki TaxID=319348 RepID=A0A9J6CNV5_POLVA|nr:hypothetical protein PVAND_013179 [Polypedilum vanderplanki]
MKVLTILIFVSSCACFLNSLSPSIDNVKLVLIQGDNIMNMKPINVTFNDTSTLMMSKSFNKSRTSVILTFGWQCNFTSPIINTIVGSYIQRRHEYNIFVLDWSTYTNQNYLASVTSIPIVADYVANNLKKLIDDDVNLENFHFIGHSLGCHLFGNIGKRLQEIANVTVSRISALDPAGPLFFPSIFLNMIKPLSSTDANFVDVIHTNSGEAGTDKQIGTVDFYPNGGSFQTNCTQLLPNLFNLLNYIIDDCNHNRAWMYFAESVLYDRKDKKFRSVKCENYKLYLQNSCTGAPVFNYMGYYVDQQARGTFFLTTNGQPPYAK